jgi:lysozyme
MKRGLLIAVLIIGGFAAWRFWTAIGRTNIFEAILTEGKLVGALIQRTPASAMQLSDDGLQKIATREGFSRFSYPDASGRSIGYGHFIKPGEQFSEPMSETTAREILRRDAQIASDAVRAYVTVPLAQNQFDALASFVYNVGVGAFRSSTLLRVLNAGNYSAAAAEFDRWHKPAIVIARRNSEKTQFLG